MWQTRPRVEVKDEQHLKQILEEANIDLSIWGTAKAKTITDLMNELTANDCYLVREKDGGLRRVVQYAEMELTFNKKVLVETHQELTGGRVRQVFSMITSKIRPDETWQVRGSCCFLANP